MTEFVADGHEQVAANARLEVLFSYAALAARKESV